MKSNQCRAATPATLKRNGLFRRTAIPSFRLRPEDLLLPRELRNHERTKNEQGNGLDDRRVSRRVLYANAPAKRRMPSHTEDTGSPKATLCGLPQALLLNGMMSLASPRLNPRRPYEPTDCHGPFSRFATNRHYFATYMSEPMEVSGRATVHEPRDERDSIQPAGEEENLIVLKVLPNLALASSSGWTARL